MPKIALAALILLALAAPIQLHRPPAPDLSQAAASRDAIVLTKLEPESAKYREEMEKILRG